MENVTAFIDSKTLRFMLKDKVLPPAVECILISKSTCRPLRDKIAAIRERLEKYTDEELAVRDFEGDAERFREWAEYYIRYNEYALNLIKTKTEGVFYVIEDDFSELCLSIYDDWLEALDWIEIYDDYSRYNCIVRLKSGSGSGYNYYINSEKEVYLIESCDPEDKWDDGFDRGLVEIPHDYKVGDIIQYNEKYYVVSNLSPYIENGHKYRCGDSDISLLCMSYIHNDMHSCNGFFSHVEIPLMQAELADIGPLAYSEKRLLELRKVLIGELSFCDFIELYSNNIK